MTNRLERLLALARMAELLARSLEAEMKRIGPTAEIDYTEARGDTTSRKAS